MSYYHHTSSSPTSSAPNNSSINNDINMMDSNYVSLNTPIKRIKNLTLNSPFESPQHLQSSPIYPNLDDIMVSPSQQQRNTNNGYNTNVNSIMTNKGYSQKLTNNVLSELNMRANQLSSMITSPTSESINAVKLSVTRRSNSKKYKRYSGIHRGLQNTMESISSHYSVAAKGHRSISGSSMTDKSPNKSPTSTPMDTNSNEELESSTKRRRTLNGPDEVARFVPTFKLAHPDSTNEINHKPSKSSTLNMTNNSNLTQPISSSNNLNSTTSTSNNSSPLRKISPSKKFMNLNALLSDNGSDVSLTQSNPTEIDMLNGSPNKDKFLKPYPPSNKLRPSALELAGVIPSSHSQTNIHPTLNKKSSIPQLQKKHSIPNLNPNTIPSLNKKSSIPQLQKKSSIPQLQKKPSIPQLQKKPSIPQLQKKPSIPTFSNHSKLVSSTSSSNMKHTQPSLSSYKIPTSRSSINTSSPKILTKSTKANEDHQFKTSRSFNGKVTIPQPFSLYDKPTVSSSQKSLYSKPTISSSQKSISKFERFKQQFQ
ncbi:uncharacterized protein RJT21DRAFT_5168 [Scheffersomyces amazonensis]|uniref:uncharacterized protein n=1 Tax=Scheffersomyces amazonensis TaxID=1078765 RepID=UPI00315D5B83